ncbi:tetratricopeptide repeat protein [Burkholderia plantarii]|nr:hypothetical protein [Burkholderia plantarii]
MNEPRPSQPCPDARMVDIVGAVQSGDENVIAMLNEARQAWPHDHRLPFLRGAVQAGERRYDEARADFVAALELAPAFSIASFMLGFLDLTNGQVERARASWQPLDALPTDETLRVLKTGLLNLAEDRFELAIAQLRAGMASNERYPLINPYVAAVLAQLEGTEPPPGGSADPHDGKAGMLGSDLPHAYPHPYFSR